MTNVEPIILSHESAVSFWRKPDARTTRVLDSREASRLLHVAGRAAHVETLRDALLLPALDGLSLPLHLLTDRRNDRRITKHAHIHCTQALFPCGSFLLAGTYALDSDNAVQVIVSSPELCFVQMAQSLDLHDLVALGYELCGRYALAPDARRGFFEHASCSTPRKIESFAHAANNMTGAKRARAAAKWLVPNAPSPEESKICMLAHMSRLQGGMGTQVPILGTSLEAPDPAARILGARNFTPALFWPDAHVAIEFSTRTWPTPEERANYDKLVRNAYRMMGISAISLGADDLHNADELRKHFDFVNRKCKRRLQPANDRQLTRQQKLIDWMLNH